MSPTNRFSTASTNDVVPPDVMEESAPVASPFYPPRARWGRTTWYRWNAFRRGFLGPLPGTAGFTVRQLIFGFTLPGYSFRLLGYPRLSHALAVGYGAAVVGFFVTLGHLPSELCFATVVSAHATSITQTLTHNLILRTLLVRLLVTVATLGALFATLYNPAREWIYREWALPLEMREGVVLVNPGLDLKTVRRGELLAYQVPGTLQNGYARREGFGLDPVVALPGETIQFWPDWYEIDGTVKRSLPHMPKSGTLQLGQKEWLIWPRSVRISYNQADQKVIQDLILDMARVNEAHLVGRPYRHWFGRRQTRL